MASFKLDGKVPYSAVGEFFGQPKEAHRALDRMDFLSSYWISNWKMAEEIESVVLGKL